MKTDLVAMVFVQTMYSTSSVYGFWKLMLHVFSHSHSFVFAARKRYIIDITWPFIFNTATSIMTSTVNPPKTIKYLVIWKRMIDI